MFIVSTLEYFNEDAKDALKEWHRTLKANGLLKLAVQILTQL